MSSTKSASLSRSSSPVPPAAPPPSEAAKELQTKLHVLLTQLGRTSELIKNWPESDAKGDNTSIHVETTNKLIASINALLKDLQQVEGVIQTNATLRKELQECPVPINLLDLLDHGDGLNPDCFSRGLLKEALGQLGGLKRRKLALEMLGAAVQAGLDHQQDYGKSSAAAEGGSSGGGGGASSTTNTTETAGAASNNNKRKLKDGGGNPSKDDPATAEGSLEPAAKKAKTKP